MLILSENFTLLSEKNNNQHGWSLSLLFYSKCCNDNRSLNKQNRCFDKHLFLLSYFTSFLKIDCQYPSGFDHTGAVNTRVILCRWTSSITWLHLHTEWWEHNLYKTITHHCNTKITPSCKSKLYFLCFFCFCTKACLDWTPPPHHNFVCFICNAWCRLCFFIPLAETLFWAIKSDVKYCGNECVFIGKSKNVPWP